MNVCDFFNEKYFIVNKVNDLFFNLNENFIKKNRNRDKNKNKN